MRALRPSSIRTGLTLLALTALTRPGSGADAGNWHPLTVLDRTIAQDRGDWQVDYRLRHDGATRLVVTPGEVVARVEGTVSNSRAVGHARPRRSAVVIAGATGMRAVAQVIASADEDRRCRERAVLWVGADGSAPAAAADPGAAGAGPLLDLAPGASFRVRLRLEHLHAVYGPYDPLLGQRSLELGLGAAALRDTLPLDHELHVAQARPSWPAPPADRRDTRQFVSAPDSLSLEADVLGHQAYRFPEQPVRYATPMRLGFWYLIAPGTEGECLARVTQYRDSPTFWKTLTSGSFEERLTEVGRWVRVEHVFRTESEATTLALDFQIDGADVGQLWIDDVVLEPVGIEPDDH
ncbi:MAG TPA: hypothetical protein VF590_23120 [Isosphaeraceae bacterium]|jgi:hypothetical protein